MKPRTREFDKLYDWRWRKARTVYIRAHPLCVTCQEQGRLTIAKVVDHKIPHKGDTQLFWDQNNWQSLCKPCHDKKTTTEDGGFHSAAMTHPEWLPKPRCPVVLVTGPPGAGKTTYCTERATASDIVIDLDDCFIAVCGVHGHQADQRFLKQAIRYRNNLLAGLKDKHQGKAYFIVTSPSRKECAWWTAKLNASHVQIDPGKDTCLSRTTGRRRQGVMQWYDKALADDWVHPSTIKPRAIGEDGWPE